MPTERRSPRVVDRCRGHTATMQGVEEQGAHIWNGEEKRLAKNRRWCVLAGITTSVTWIICGPATTHCPRIGRWEWMA